MFLLELDLSYIIYASMVSYTPAFAVKLSKHRVGMGTQAFMREGLLLQRITHYMSQFTIITGSQSLSGRGEVASNIGQFIHVTMSVCAYLLGRTQ